MDKEKTMDISNNVNNILSRLCYTSQSKSQNARSDELSGEHSITPGLLAMILLINLYFV